MQVSVGAVAKQVHYLLSYSGPTAKKPRTVIPLRPGPASVLGDSQCPNIPQWLRNVNDLCAGEFTVSVGSGVERVRTPHGDERCCCLSLQVSFTCMARLSQLFTVVGALRKGWLAGVFIAISQPRWHLWQTATIRPPGAFLAVRWVWSFRHHSA